MKKSKIFSSATTSLVVIFIVYLLINIIHFSWIIAEPEGFWGFFFFLSVFGVIITAVIVIIGIMFFLFTGTLFLFSNFPKNITLKNILKPIGILLVILAIIFINTLTGSGISMYVYKKIADRYSYINQSEKLFKEGEFIKALDNSKMAYDKYGNISKSNSFFIFSWFFQHTEYGIRNALIKQYSTTINYAYCLDQNRTNLGLAEKLYIAALTLSDSPLLKEEQDYKIFPLLSLADLNLSQGRYQQAETYFNNLLQYSNKSTKEDIEYVSMVQESFASYYLQVGDFNKAKNLREKNVKLFEEKNQNLKSLQYLLTLLGAASTEIISQNFDQAGEYLIKAKPLAEKRNEKAVYQFFQQLKAVYCSHISINGNGNEKIIDNSWIDKIVSIFKKRKTSSEKFKAEAEATFLEILNFEKKTNGDKSIEYAQGLKQLATFYIEQGDNLKANQLLNNAKNISEKYKKSDLQLYYSVLLELTISDYSLKGYDAVKQYISEIEQFNFNKLINKYAFLTERERETYKNLIDNNIEPINSIYIATNSSDTREKLYNNIIATKEIALYANENTRKCLATISDSLKNEYYAILKQRDTIEIDKNRSNNENDINNIRIKERAIQTKISSMPGFKQFDPRSITWKNISESLKENEIAIEFVHRKIIKSEQYYALIIKKDITSPELIPLFEEKYLIKLLNQPGNSQDRISTTYDKYKDSLYSLVWKPLEKKLTNIKKAYISVSGILYSVSFPAMLDDKSIDLIFLGSTRQVAMKTDDKEQKYTSAVLVGGINYGKNLNIKKGGINRNDYTYLPFTIKEVKDINKIIITNRPQIKTNLVMDNSASEANFREFEKTKPNLLHLATHGYFYPGNKIISSDFLSEKFSIPNLSPMLRSGIILAGANESQDKDTENDGFLSAQEIARLNFAELDLVVLSACETGLGDAIGSEGVFGLQRAFKIAGAKSLIMSLWKVPDEQTSELMSCFYSNYMKGMTKSQSLKQAQLAMKKIYKSPFFWGGFILLER